MNMNSMKRFGAFVLIGMLLLGATGFASGQDTTTEAVDSNKLKTCLPEAPFGWEGTEPIGAMYTVKGGTWSKVTKSYSTFGVKDQVEITIMDSVSHVVPLWSKWDRFYKWKSSEGYTKRTTVNEFPAWEVYAVEVNSYMLYVGINDRFLVLTKTKNTDKATLDSFANSIDYNEIAALEGGGEAPPAETPTPTPTPTPIPTPIPTPAPPGFEAVFAIAGLLAVAYLVKRRN